MQKAILNAEINPSSVRNITGIKKNFDGATILLADLIAESRVSGASEDEVSLLLEQAVKGAESLAVTFEALMRIEKEQVNA